MPPKHNYSRLDAVERIRSISHYLDVNVSQIYKDQPLAQDWARISKIGEEYGEAVSAFIGWTGQNPRKGQYGDRPDFIKELLDVAVTAILAVQHFTEDENETFFLLVQRIAQVHKRLMNPDLPFETVAADGDAEETG